jgi:hypothetical protein
MRVFLLTLFALSPLWSADGYNVYLKHCSSCHVEMMDKATTIKRFRTLKAPPMVEVSNRLRTNIVIADEDEDVHRHLVTLFIRDYIDNPELYKTMCQPMALERFGVMPSLKGVLSDEEKQAVAEWIYDRYENSAFE